MKVREAGLGIAFAAAMAIAFPRIDAQEGRAAEPGATAELKNPRGEIVGTMELFDGRHGIIARLSLSGLPAGTHALHFHEVGKCDPPGFESAGGHVNPQKSAHGFMNEKGPHDGDLPNIYGSGRRESEYFVDAVTLREGARSLLDADGSAVVIHAGGDDYHTDPDGAAGPRIACGVVQRPAVR